MNGSRHPAIHQFSPTATYGDAVTNGMLLTRTLLQGLGFESQVWIGGAIDPRLGDGLRDARRYPARAGDVLLVHHALGHDPLLPWLRGLPDRKILVYHNVTPPEFFPDDPHLHRLAELGRAQLRELRPHVTAAFCPSAYNARELQACGYERVRVLPLLLATDRLREAPFSARVVEDNAGVHTMLAVGRVERNKCPHDVIDVFVRVSRWLGRPAQCVLVGRFDERVPFIHELRRHAARAGVATGIRFVGHVSDDDLRGWYRAADVLLSMSEHEGFGVPLVEAMALDVPVIAHDSSSVADTLGGAGLLVPGKPLDEIAGLVCLLARDAALRQRVVARQRARADAFSAPALQAALGDALAELGVSVRTRGRFALDRPPDMSRSPMSAPEIDVDDVRRRAREEAERHAPPAPPAPEPPRDEVASAWASAHRAIADAERYVEVGVNLPPMSQLSGWRRWLAVPLGRAILRAAKLFTRDQRSFNVESLLALRAVADAAGAQVREVEQQLAEARRGYDEALARLSADVERHTELVRQALEATQRAAAASAAATEARVEQALAAAREELAARGDALARQVGGEIDRLRLQVGLQDRSLRLLAEPQGAAAAPTPAQAAERDRLLDTFYIEFEDRFRGSRDEIKERVTVYLPVVREAGAGTPERPIVDLGCGRGEWLEVLAGAGLTARGVDTNRAMVAESGARGLDVAEGEALAYLRGLPDASCGAVTAFHLLEHLPFETLVAVIDEIVRVLQPGGVTILETPNPQNLMVGACFFYVDPTHRNPLHPATLAFVAESRGLRRVEVRYLHPAGEQFRLADDGTPLVKRLNEYFFGPMDFAVIGYRT